MEGVVWVFTPEAAADLGSPTTCVEGRGESFPVATGRRAPHPPQNTSSSSAGNPHLKQKRNNGKAQRVQYLGPSLFSNPQPGHAIFFFFSIFLNIAISSRFKNVTIQLFNKTLCRSIYK
jgi:hypothetical protein